LHKRTKNISGGQDFRLTLSKKKIDRLQNIFQRRVLKEYGGREREGTRDILEKNKEKKRDRNGRIGKKKKKKRTKMLEEDKEGVDKDHV
jgi:hypothetical protein